MNSITMICERLPRSCLQDEGVQRCLKEVNQSLCKKPGSPVESALQNMASRIEELVSCLVQRLPLENPEHQKVILSCIESFQTEQKTLGRAQSAFHRTRTALEDAFSQASLAGQTNSGEGLDEDSVLSRRKWLDTHSIIGGF